MILQRKIIKESILEYCNKNNKELLKEWDFSRNIKEPKDYGKVVVKKFIGYVRMVTHGRQGLQTEYVEMVVRIALVRYLLLE